MMKKSIGIGFVGGGFITRFHIQSLIGVRNCEVLGVMSRTKSLRRNQLLWLERLELGKPKPILFLIWLLIQILTLYGYGPNYTRIEIMKKLLIPLRMERVS